MKKALIVAHVASMIDLFNRDNIILLQKKGYIVDIACNFSNGNVTSSQRLQEFKEELITMKVNIHHIPFPRKISALNELILSYKLLRNILLRNNYQLVHCQSPIAGVLTRITCKNTNSCIKLLYMAHGFHFYYGASLLNWIIYYNIEKYCAKYTDVILTINKEDFNLALKKFKKTRAIHYVPGVGVDNKKIDSIVVRKEEKLKDLGIPIGATIFISVGELNKNKNHQAVIKALADLDKRNIYYIICGIGPLQPMLIQLINHCNLNKNVKLLEYREDIIELLKISDAFVFPSKREGLSLSVMEAMSAGLPVLCSNIRGNVDLINHGEGGYLFKYNDIKTISNYMDIISNNKELRRKMGLINKKNIENKDIKKVNQIMSSIYDELEVLT